MTEWVTCTDGSLDGNWVSAHMHGWLVANANWAAYQMKVGILGNWVSDTIGW